MGMSRTPWLLVLCLGVAHAGDPIAEHDRAHGRPELVRVGTIGDRPPAESTLVVHVHADGAILVDGKETTLDDLSAAFRRHREAHVEPTVLLRADARLPWKAIAWLLTICAEQDIDRVFHAVLPETGGDEGAFFWRLPRWRAAVDAMRGGTWFPTTVMVAFQAPAAAPADVYWAAREAKANEVELRAAKGVPLALVLRVADALCRAGVTQVAWFPDIPLHKWRALDLRPVVKHLAALPGSWAWPSDPKDAGRARWDDRAVDTTSISIRFSDRPLGSGKADPMPPVNRVRGGFAGWAEPPADPPEIPEPDGSGVPEPEIPEEQIVDGEMPKEDPGEAAEEGVEQDPGGAPGGDPGGAAEAEEGLSDAPFTGQPAPGAEPPRRGPGGKRDLRGGVRLEENAVDFGLAWLAAHQDVADDGKWDCDGFMKHDPEGDRCDGAGGALNDVGVTSLAVLAFLGAGYTDRGIAKENRYAKHVRAGAPYLILAQADDGAFGPRETQSFIYNHAMATLAVCELFWMTKNPRYKKPAQDGLNFLAAARNPLGAWRYRPRGGDNDTSVTVWCLMALRSGRFAGLEVDPDGFEGARQWIDQVTDPETGRVGYLARGGPSFRPKGMEARWPASATHAMTAAGTLGRIFLGEDPQTSEIVAKGARLCADRPPVWNPDAGSIDMDYWYFGTLALFQVGGPSWQVWAGNMEDAIIRHQHPQGTGARAGSWDPLGPWGPDGGRVYATALMTMALEVYYRYDRVFGAK